MRATDRFILAALRKDAVNRTDLELAVLHSFVAGNAAFCAPFPRAIQVNLAQVLRFQAIPDGKVFFQQGAPISEQSQVFIVRTGSVIVWAQPSPEALWRGQEAAAAAEAEGYMAGGGAGGQPANERGPRKRRSSLVVRRRSSKSPAPGRRSRDLSPKPAAAGRRSRDLSVNLGHKSSGQPKLSAMQVALEEARMLHADSSPEAVAAMQAAAAVAVAEGRFQPLCELGEAIATHQSGDTFGDCLDARRYAVTAVAQEPCEVVSILKADLDRVLRYTSVDVPDPTDCLRALGKLPPERNDDHIAAIQAQLSRFRVFSQLPAPQLADLARSCALRGTHPGVPVIRQGEPMEYFVLVLEGVVEVYTTSVVDESAGGEGEEGGGGGGGGEGEEGEDKAALELPAELEEGAAPPGTAATSRPATTATAASSASNSKSKSTSKEEFSGRNGYGLHVATLEVGDGFGAMTLKAARPKNTATLLPRRNATVLLLRADEFKRAFAAFQQTVSFSLETVERTLRAPPAQRALSNVSQALLLFKCHPLNLFFDQMPMQVAEKVAEVATLEHVPADTQILKQVDGLSTDLFILVDGVVQVLAAHIRKAGGGALSRLRKATKLVASAASGGRDGSGGGGGVLLPGDSFGAAHHFARVALRGRAVASSDCMLLRVREADFVRQLGDSAKAMVPQPVFALRVLQMPVGGRSPDQLNEALPAAKHVTFFKQLPTSHLVKFLSVMTSASYTEGELVELPPAEFLVVVLLGSITVRPGAPSATGVTNLTRVGSEVAKLSMGAHFTREQVQKWSESRSAFLYAEQRTTVALLTGVAYHDYAHKRMNHKARHISPDAIVSLQKPPATRSEEDVVRLMGLASGSLFFQQLPRIKQRLLCQTMRYRRVDAGQVVFFQGDNEDLAFYMLLTGSVSVHIRKRGVADVRRRVEAVQSKTEGGKQQKNKKKNKKLSPRRRSPPPVGAARARRTTTRLPLPSAAAAAASAEPEQPPLYVDFKDADRLLGPNVCLLAVGDSFGEAALHGDGGARNATILARTQCQLFRLDRDDYLRVLQDLSVELEFRNVEKRRQRPKHRRGMQTLAAVATAAAAKNRAERAAEMRQLLERGLTSVEDGERMLAQRRRLTALMLRRLPEVAALPDEAVARLAEGARLVVLPENRNVYASEDAMGFYMLLSGEVSLVVPSTVYARRGASASLHVLGTRSELGAAFGAFELLTQAPRRYNMARTRAPTRAMALVMDDATAALPAMVQAERDIDALYNCPAVACIEPERVACVFASAEAVKFRLHQVVARQGQLNEGFMHLVTDGAARIERRERVQEDAGLLPSLSVHIPSTVDTIVSTIGRGAVFGHTREMEFGVRCSSAELRCLALDLDLLHRFIPRRELDGVRAWFAAAVDWRQQRHQRACETIADPREFLKEALSVRTPAALIGSPLSSSSSSKKTKETPPKPTLGRVRNTPPDPWKARTAGPGERHKARTRLWGSVKRATPVPIRARVPLPPPVVAPSPVSASPVRSPSPTPSPLPSPSPSSSSLRHAASMPLLRSGASSPIAASSLRIDTDEEPPKWSSPPTSPFTAANSTFGVEELKLRAGVGVAFDSVVVESWPDSEGDTEGAPTWVAPSSPGDGSGGDDEVIEDVGEEPVMEPVAEEEVVEEVEEVEEVEVEAVAEVEDVAEDVVEDEDGEGTDYGTEDDEGGAESDFEIDYNERPRSNLPPLYQPPADDSSHILDVVVRQHGAQPELPPAPEHKYVAPSTTDSISEERARRRRIRLRQKLALSSVPQKRRQRTPDHTVILDALITHTRRAKKKVSKTRKQVALRARARRAANTAQPADERLAAAQGMLCGSF